MRALGVRALNVTRFWLVVKSYLLTDWVRGPDACVGRQIMFLLTDWEGRYGPYTGILQARGAGPYGSYDTEIEFLPGSALVIDYK